MMSLLTYQGKYITQGCNDPAGPDDAYFVQIDANSAYTEVDAIGLSKKQGFSIRLIKNS